MSRVKVNSNPVKWRMAARLFATAETAEATEHYRTLAKKYFNLDWVPRENY